MRQLGAGEIRALRRGAGGKQELGIGEYSAVVEDHLPGRRIDARDLRSQHQSDAIL